MILISLPALDLQEEAGTLACGLIWLVFVLLVKSVCTEMICSQSDSFSVRPVLGLYSGIPPVVDELYPFQFTKSPGGLLIL